MRIRKTVLKLEVSIVVKPLSLEYCSIPSDERRYQACWLVPPKGLVGVDVVCIFFKFSPHFKPTGIGLPLVLLHLYKLTAATITVFDFPTQKNEQINTTSYLLIRPFAYSLIRLFAYSYSFKIIGM